jgi:hypothetical protein
VQLGLNTNNGTALQQQDEAADVQPLDGTAAAQAQVNTAAVQPPDGSPTCPEATCTKATCTTESAVQAQDDTAGGQPLIPAEKLVWSGSWAEDWDNMGETHGHCHKCSWAHVHHHSLETQPQIQPGLIQQELHTQ